jgi:hypothetical protein
MALAKRMGDIQLFAQYVDGDRQDGMRVGIVTYHDNDEYRITHLSGNVRSDHFYVPATEFLQNSDAVERLTTTDPLECDREILREDTEVAKKREELTNTPPTVKPLATVAE